MYGSRTEMTNFNSNMDENLPEFQVFLLLYLSSLFYILFIAMSIMFKIYLSGDLLLVKKQLHLKFDVGDGHHIKH